MRPNLALAISLLGIALASSTLKAQEQHHESVGKEAKPAVMVEGYSVIATALYKDDLEAAKMAAGGLVKSDKDNALLKHYQAIADSKTLDEARIHFKELSDAAIPPAKEKKTLHEMHCPMAFGGKGASWLQKSPNEVQNPYFGAKMPHCGDEVK